MRDDRERLRDILDAIGRIERHSSRGRGVFDGDELVQVWIVHHLAIIGEAAAKLTQEMRASMAEVPWPEIIGMRNILVHEYFGVDRDIVWAVVEKDLPPLRDAIRLRLDAD